MCQLQITVHHSLFIYKTSHEPVPTARGLLRLPTPSAQIQGLLGAPPPDPWLHPNIGLGFTEFQTSHLSICSVCPPVYICPPIYICPSDPICPSVHPVHLSICPPIPSVHLFTSVHPSFPSVHLFPSLHLFHPSTCSCLSICSLHLFTSASMFHLSTHSHLICSIC